LDKRLTGSEKKSTKKSQILFDKTGNRGPKFKTPITKQ